MPQHRLYGLRGQAYVAKYKQILSEDGEAIKAAFSAILVTKGKFTPNDLGSLCNQFGLPLTLMDDCLPELSEFRYATGTWDRLKDRGVKAHDIGVEWSDK
jgi:hypothetical protein